MKDAISRRDVLQGTLKGAAGLAVLSLAGPALLSSCNKKSPTQDQNASEQQGSPSCPGSESLNAEQMASRKTLNYVDQSPISTRTCANCKLYINPAAGSPCGTCQIVQGPIHPKGHCTSWIARM